MARGSQTRGQQLSMLGLLEVPRPPRPVGGSLDFGLELRGTLSQILKDCPLSREEVAGRMSFLLGQEVTIHQLNSWTAESRPGWRFPFEFAAALEAATESYGLVELLASKRGCAVLVGKETVQARLIKMHARKDNLLKQIKQMESLLAHLEDEL